MNLLRYSISVVAATIACVALLLISAAAPVRAAEPGCDSAAMYVAAHADDTLLFQSPSLLQDVYSERCVRTVFLTAGDAGRAVSYWGKREDGAEAAYAQMAGVANQWTSSQIDVNGNTLRLETLKAQPKISIVYLRLPDGGTGGAGFSMYGNHSLTKLWRSVKGGSPSLSSIEAVDDSETYNFADLVDTLTELMDSFEPSQVATQNYTQALVGPDHADHVATAKFAQEAAAQYGEAHRLAAFEDYEISSKPQNVFGDLLGAKSFAFYTYGAHDSDACDSESHCAETAYAKWLLREYLADTETTGVVAHAGYRQLVETGEEVTLDGSQSSSESGDDLDYAWTQIGGPAVSLADADTDEPSFTTPAHPTLLTFSLTVKDGATSSAADIVRVRVPSSDPTPTAVAGSSQTVGSGSTVTLDGSGSWDPNSLPLQYAWLQTAGPAVTLSGSSTAKPSFTAPTGPATLKFSLAVSNGNQTSALSSVTVNVNGVAPSFTSANATTFTTGVAKSFTVSTSGSPTAAIAKTAGSLPSGLSFTDNGDGTATISGTAAAAAAPPASTQGYPLTLKASSAAGEASQSFTLTVSNPGAAPAFTSANTTTFTTGVAKSFTVSTIGSPIAALAKTGTLPSGLTFTDNGDGTATISGTAAAAAAPPASTQNYPLTLKASSAAGEASQAFTLTVSNPGVAPSFTSANATTFTTGVAKSFTVSTTGSPTAALAKTSGSLPSGLAFKDNGDGTATISGTAAASEAPPAGTKNYGLTLKASSAAGEASQSFTLTVSNPGAAPAFTSANTTTFTTGVAKSFTVSTTGSPIAALAKTGTLPSGLTFTDNGDGTATISGTAAAAAAPPASTQNYPLTLKASSAAGEASQTFTLTVSNPGVAPSFTSANATTFTTGVAKSFTVSTSGSPTATLAKTGALPSGLSFTDNGDGTATISGTAAASEAPPAGTKNYGLTLKASSAAGEASQSFTLTVSNPGVAPSFTSANATTFTTGVAKSFTVSTTGSPTAALAKTGALPSGLSFTDNGDGTATISGTAAASEAPPAGTKNYGLTLKASSAAGEASQSFTLTVSNPGTAPAFTSSNSTTFTTGVAKSFTVSTTGSPAAVLAKTGGSLPSGLNFTDNGDGTATISGTAAAAAAPPASTQNYPLTFKASSAAGEASQSFTLTVSNPGVAPSFTSANATTFTTGVAKSFTVSTSGSPTATLAKTGGSLPSGLAFKDNGDGTATISGTAAAAAAPPASTQGYPLTLKANSAAGEVTQSFTLTVSNPGVAPSFTSANAAAFTTGVAKSFTVSTTGSPAAALAKTGALPSGLSFTDNGDGTATISGTASADSAPPAGSQNYPLALEAESAAGGVSQAFTLTVENPGVGPAFTSADATTFTVGVAKTFTISTTSAPTAALARALGDLPAGLTFTDNGDGRATISGTAAAGSIPPESTVDFPLVLEASSAAGSATQDFTLSVNNPETEPEPEPEPEKEKPPVIPPVVDDRPPPALPPVVSPPPAGKPPVALSRSKVRLLVGKRTRHLVRVTAWPPAAVRCSGELPRGARCRVTEQRDLVVEGSKNVRRVGTYRLTIEVADEHGVQSQPLVVQVKRPDDRDVSPRRPSARAQRP